MTPRGRPLNETVLLVECVDSDVGNALEGTAVGADVRVESERVGRLGNAWRAPVARHT